MKEFLEECGWFIIIVVVFVVLPMVGMAIDSSQKNGLISACIQSGRNPVIENGNLKECKDER